MKPYKFNRSKQLKQDHVKQRFEFCARFLSEDIDPQKILFSDEM